MNFPYIFVCMYNELHLKPTYVSIRTFNTFVYVIHINVEHVYVRVYLHICSERIMEDMLYLSLGLKRSFGPLDNWPEWLFII